MGDMIRCPKCQTYHYRNDPCPYAVMTMNNHQRFACEVSSITRQRRSGISHADASFRAAKSIPDEYEGDTPGPIESVAAEFGIEPSAIRQACAALQLAPEGTEVCSLFLKGPQVDVLYAAVEKTGLSLETLVVTAVRSQLSSGEVVLSMDLATLKEFARLVESNDMSDDAPLGVLVREVMNG